MKTLGWLFAVTTLAAMTAACDSPPTINLGPDGDDDGGGGSGAQGGAGGAGAAGAAGPGAGAGTPGGAQEMFVNQVYPAITADCTSCHAGVEYAGAPIFLSTNAGPSYNAIIAYTPSLIAVPENSNLILHGVHTGPALTPAQTALVSEWLQLEAEERGLVGGDPEDPPPPTQTLAGALEEFGNCMNLDDWIATGMNNLAQAQTAAGACTGCHSSGDGGAYLAAPVEATFEANRTMPYVKKLVSGTVDMNGAFAGLVDARRFINKGPEAGNCNPETDNCHPVYSLSPNNTSAVENFVDLTLDRMEAGPCTPEP